MATTDAICMHQDQMVVKLWQNGESWMQVVKHLVWIFGEAVADV